MLDLTNVIRQRISKNEKSICEKCSHKRVCRAIDNQPCFECNQFEQEAVHAEWIEGYSGREKYRYDLECSNCGFWFKTPCEHEYQIQDYKKDFEHCPCCGAVMDGGNEDG